MTKMLISLIIFVVYASGRWRMYSKAGMPGWVGVIPGLSLLGALRMIRKPYWWALLCLVPFLGVVVHFAVWMRVARSFGKGFLFSVAAGCLPWVFTPMIGLSDARYVGPRS